MTESDKCTKFEDTYLIVQMFFFINMQFIYLYIIYKVTIFAGILRYGPRTHLPVRQPAGQLAGRPQEPDRQDWAVHYFYCPPPIATLPRLLCLVYLVYQATCSYRTSTISTVPFLGYFANSA